MEAIKAEGCDLQYISEGCPTPSDLEAAQRVSDHYPVQVTLSIQMGSETSGSNSITQSSTQSDTETMAETETSSQAMSTNVGVCFVAILLLCKITI